MTFLDLVTSFLFIAALAMALVGIPASIAYGIWRMCGKDEYVETERGRITYEPEDVS